ncbi:hypothetical protein [Peribacillus kribbensis]|nr:hypothetical protein [Peribacillus kribbensis]
METTNHNLDQNMGGGPVKERLESDNAFSTSGLKNLRLTKKAVRGSYKQH